MLVRDPGHLFVGRRGGDDRGDLPAYDGLDRLATRGVHAVRVAVAGAETPPELLARADLILDGPAAVLDLLRRL